MRKRTAGTAAPKEPVVEGADALAEHGFVDRADEGSIAVDAVEEVHATHPVDGEKVQEVARQGVVRPTKARLLLLVDVRVGQE